VVGRGEGFTVKLVTVCTERRHRVFNRRIGHSWRLVEALVELLGVSRGFYECIPKYTNMTMDARTISYGFQVLYSNADIKCHLAADQCTISHYTPSYQYAHIS
jgi:hypothetical protein